MAGVLNKPLSLPPIHGLILGTPYKFMTSPPNTLPTRTRNEYFFNKATCSKAEKQQLDKVISDPHADRDIITPEHNIYGLTGIKRRGEVYPGRTWQIDNILETYTHNLTNCDHNIHYTQAPGQAHRHPV